MLPFFRHLGMFEIVLPGNVGPLEQGDGGQGFRGIGSRLPGMELIGDGRHFFQLFLVHMALLSAMVSANRAASRASFPGSGVRVTRHLWVLSSSTLSMSCS